MDSRPARRRCTSRARSIRIVMTVRVRHRGQMKENIIALLQNVGEKGLSVGELAKKYRKLVPPIVRFLLRGMGSEQGDSSDILSYLLFVPEFLQKLVDLGYQDARAEHDRLLQFIRD